MDLKSPSTLFTAWVLAPVVILLAATTLGWLVARISGVSFGALTLPVGFLTGIVLMTGLLKLGAGGTTAVVVVVVLALAGAALEFREQHRHGFALRRVADHFRTAPDTVAPALAAIAAYLFALAPLAGSGRAGVVGYILNNDSFVHSTLVELLRSNGAEAPTDSFSSSYDSIAGLFGDGYPLGSHVWPLFAGATTGAESSHLWTPAIAVAAAMLALVAYACLRRLDATPRVAAIAAALIPCGYLFYSFLTQGSAKEGVTAVAVYGSIAVAGHIVLDNATPRALPAVALAPAAALFTFGAGAASWIGPALVAFVVIAAWRLRRVRPPRSVLIGAGVTTAAVAVIAVPLISEALDYVRSAEGTLRNPAQVGNLLGAVPWEQSFNLWFAYDYRIDPPIWQRLSEIGPWFAGTFAVVGLVYALLRRELVIPLVVLAGVVAAVIISERYSIYLDTKSYAILGPALGIATAAGVVALLAGPHVVRLVGTVAGVLLAAGVLGGAAFVYLGAWVTPEERFEELAAIADRFAGDGPILINEREEWDSYLLRDSEPVEPWGVWFPLRGFRNDGNFPPAQPHTPDFDDYTEDYLRDFKLLLERKGPGGSRAPSNYEVVHETVHYRVWEQKGPHAERHLPLGLYTLDNAETLDCGARAVRDLFRAARRSGRDIVASVPPGRTYLVAGPESWVGHEIRVEPPPTGMINRRGGSAAARIEVPAGSYTAWIQGSFGPGVGLFVDGAAYGVAFGDLALASAWHPLGEVRSPGRELDVRIISLEKPSWQSGSQRSDLTGQLVFEPSGEKHDLRRVDPDALSSLCGERLDWLELYS